MYAVVEEECSRRRVVELPTIVALDVFHLGAELGTDIRKKLSDGFKRVRFQASWSAKNHQD